MVPPGGILDENRVVHDTAGNVLADYSAPCPAALAGAASTPDPRGPFDEYVLAYLDENKYPMWTGLDSFFQVPAHIPAASTDQALYWSARLIAGSTSSPVSFLQMLESGVSYGPWPGVTGLTSGSYYAWSRVQVDEANSFYSPPVAVRPGANVHITIQFMGFLSSSEPPEVAIYDSSTAFQWKITTLVDGVPIPGFYVSTNSLGVVAWTAAEPGVMSIWNMPGTGVSTCGEAMPSDGQMMVGPFQFATAPATAPTSMSWGPSSQPIVNYGSLPGTPHLNCPTWDPNSNVILSPPSHATLTWPTNGTAASPLPIVPAVPRHVLAGLALLLVLVGARSLRRSRS
jgi:hypothetical protein